MAERVRVRELDDDEGARLLRIIRRGSGSVVTMRNNPTPRTGRRGPLRRDATLVEKMDRKVSVKKGRTIYRRRQQSIEPVFGKIKDARGIRGCMRTGKAAADSEWKLICGTHNLLKLYRRALTNASAAPYSRMTAAIATCRRSDQHADQHAQRLPRGDPAPLLFPQPLHH
jgi:hypothetical protein